MTTPRQNAIADLAYRTIHHIIDLGLYDAPEIRNGPDRTVQLAIDILEVLPIHERVNMRMEDLAVEAAYAVAETLEMMAEDEEAFEAEFQAGF